MPATNVHKAETWAGSGVFLMHRILNSAGNNAQQSDVSSIAYSTSLESAPDTEVASGSLTVANVIFDSLQEASGPRWKRDNTGYNFLWEAPASIFPTGGTTVIVVITFTPASGEVFKEVWHVKVKDPTRRQ